MRIRLLFILLIFSSLLWVGCQTHPNIKGVNGKVQRVISGQTIEVLIGADNKLQKVRLIGINAPDLKQKPWGINAKNKLTELINKQEVLLEFGQPENDKFGRKLAYIWLEGRLINEQLIAEGYVLDAVDFDHKYSKLYQRAQETARLQELGIWNIREPLRQTPQEFRQELTVNN